MRNNQKKSRIVRFIIENIRRENVTVSMSLKKFSSSNTGVSSQILVLLEASLNMAKKSNVAPSTCCHQLTRQ